MPRPQYSVLSLSAQVVANCAPGSQQKNQGTACASSALQSLQWKNATVHSQAALDKHKTETKFLS